MNYLATNWVRVFPELFVQDKSVPGNPILNRITINYSKSIGKYIKHAMDIDVKKIILLFLCSFSCAFAEKILIFTYSYNRPDFIEIQYKTFKQFLKDDYEFVVFNDAPKKEMQEKIRGMCKKLNLTCIDIPQSIHSKPYLRRWPGEDYNQPSIRNSNVVQYSLDHYGFKHNGIVALFDSDLFLVKEFSIKNFLQNYSLSGLRQIKKQGDIHIEYLWIGLVFLDMRKMPNKESLNFNCGRIRNVAVDAGGHTYYYLQEHPEAQVRYLNEICSPFSLCPVCKKENNLFCVHNDEVLKARGFDNDQIKAIQSGLVSCSFMGNNCFFHYRGGTNWNNLPEEFHKRKTKIFNEYLNRILP